jgi:hypothetical protein
MLQNAKRSPRMPRKLTFPVFDGDNHRYETREALATASAGNLARLMRTGA